MAELKAVLFDVDFTLARPGPSSARRATSARASATAWRSTRRRYEEARDAALVDLPPPSRARARRRDLVPLHRADHPRHGRRRPTRRTTARVEITRGWERHENFELYEDVPAELAELRAAGLRIGLVSNSARDVREFVAPPRARRRRGDQLLPPRPHEAARLDLPGGARSARCRAGRGGDGRRLRSPTTSTAPRAIGMRAILLDRDGLHPDFEPRITDLHELLPRLGLQA